MFGTSKPIIAMLHLDPLPGDPLFRRDTDMKQVAAVARQDLAALQDGGVDGILFSNEFSLPYQHHMNFVTPSAMAFVIGQLLPQIRVPFGVDCLSDPMATLELAAAIQADFVRGMFSGAYVGDEGLYDNDLSALLRRKAALPLDDLKMLYFVNPESDVNLDTRPLPEIAKSVIFKAHPDALCVSGPGAGQAVDESLMIGVKEQSGDVPVFVNTGCRQENIEAKLRIADGAVVGTTFKVAGEFNNHIDDARVRSFMAAAKAARTSAPGVAFS